MVNKPWQKSRRENQEFKTNALAGHGLTAAALLGGNTIMKKSRNILQTSRTYSPMIFTSTRFFRLPSNSP